MTPMTHGTMKPYYLFSPFLRFFHWIMVLAILVLFVTGLYIGDPGYVGNQGLEPTFAVATWFSMETIRFIHFASAFLFMGSFVFRIYGFAINKGDRLFPRPWKLEYWLGMLDVGLHYLLLSPHHRPYLRNHMARAGYATAYLMIFIEIVTGLAMYFMIHPNGWGAFLFGPFVYWLGGEYWLHLLHHYAAWAIMLFSIVHVYMAVRADIIEGGGEISSMISGVKYFHEDPDDLGDIR